jgi:hypothetical protein
VDREFLYRFEDELNRARYEIDEGYHRMSALDKVRQALGGKRATVNYGPRGETYVNLPEKSIEVLPHDTVEDIKAKLANPFEKKQMSITDAGKLAGTIKDRINTAKQRIAQVSANTDGALAKLNDAADTGDKIAKQIEKEASELLAEIGQFDNGGPEL